MFATNQSRIFYYSLLLSKTIKLRIFRTINLPVFLYGHETWSLTLREKRTMMMFENRALRRILEPKRYKVTGDRKKLHNEELHNLWLDNIKMDLRKTGWDGMDWIDLAEDRNQWRACEHGMNLGVP
ncbi:hypothetical protein B7P43_G03393 [Cryptotermes secundus]|uniref:Uncharacterized protein n=1 Tax=Cryptotermes secundus TaxID=105785 RepID=A0A2J7QDN9_9NEOP|nr:hypothetical protein B7P43_G03393 [Cryptotermes secundus]